MSVPLDVRGQDRPVVSHAVDRRPLTQADLELVQSVARSPARARVETVPASSTTMMLTWSKTGRRRLNTWALPIRDTGKVLTSTSVRGRGTSSCDTTLDEWTIMGVPLAARRWDSLPGLGLHHQ